MQKKSGELFSVADAVTEMIPDEIHREKRIKKKKIARASVGCGITLNSWMCLIGDPRRGYLEGKKEKIIEEMMAGTFPNW